MSAELVADADAFGTDAMAAVSPAHDWRAA